jgi:hypothetical protein
VIKDGKILVYVDVFGSKYAIVYVKTASVQVSNRVNEG